MVLARWLTSTLTWGPLVAWVIWLLLDRRLTLSPWVAGASAVALGSGWGYAGWRGIRGVVWTAGLIALAVFAVSYCVAMGSEDIGTFVAVSLLGWGIAHCLLGGLVSLWAAGRARGESYDAAEEGILRTIMVTMMALMSGVTVARIGSRPALVLLGVLTGVLFGVIVAWLVFGVVYAIMNIVLTAALQR